MIHFRSSFNNYETRQLIIIFYFYQINKFDDIYIILLNYEIS